MTMSHPSSWTRPLCVAVVVAGTATLAGSVAAATRQSEPSQTLQSASTPHGSSTYRTYCASCHGESARGDGPLATSLRRRPANLTEIAKRNGGVYPREVVFKVIDGRQKVAGHGGPDMPVWGDAFRRSAEVSDDGAVAMRIQTLVDYLGTLQTNNTP
jgi:mono/diheme cytochrome c family protein